MIAEAENWFSRLDVLVVNAGTMEVGTAEHKGTDESAEIMDLTLWGSCVPTLATLPMPRRTKDRVLAITSISGKPNLLPYRSLSMPLSGSSRGCTSKQPSTARTDGIFSP